MNINTSFSALISGTLLMLGAGCTTLSETRVRELNRMADNALAKTVLEHPGLHAELGTTAGYIAIERSGSGMPMVGKRGIGILVERASGGRSTISVTRLEVDGAWGVGDYIGLMTIKDEESLARIHDGGLTQENCGPIYIYVKGEPSAPYPVKMITVVEKK